MAARTLQQITNELNKADAGQIKSLQSRQALIPGQIAEEQKGLEAKQTQAFDTILGGARQRGLGFAGIPLGEQAKYTSTEFLPALARLRQQGREQEMSLTDAIMGIRSGNAKTAQGLRQQELDRSEQKRQFNLNYRLAQQQAADARRAARSAGAAGFSPSYGGGSVPGGSQNSGASFTRKSDGGFAFSGSSGKPISAARYAQVTKQPIGQILYQMGQAGDQYAAQLYNQLKNDKLFQSGDKAYLARIKKAYSPIFWGT